MSLYPTILFLHILSAAGFLLGNGLEWTASSLLRRATTAEQVRSWLRVYRVSPPLSGVSLLVLILTGGYLASIIGAMKQGWMSASLVALVFAFSLGFIINLPRIQAIRNSIPSSGEALSAEIQVKLKNAALVTSVRIRTMLAAAIIGLMTIKPSTSLSFAIAGGAAILGLLLAIPAWSDKTTSS